MQGRNVSGIFVRVDEVGRGGGGPQRSFIGFVFLRRHTHTHKQYQRLP